MCESERARASDGRPEVVVTHSFPGDKSMNLLFTHKSAVRRQSHIGTDLPMMLQTNRNDKIYILMIFDISA